MGNIRGALERLVGYRMGGKRKMTTWMIASAYKHAVKRLWVGANWRFFLFVCFPSTRKGIMAPEKGKQ